MHTSNDWHTISDAKERKVSRLISNPKLLANTVLLAMLCFPELPSFAQVEQNSQLTVQQQAIPQENRANQIIRVRLKLSGPDNEWIRIETSSSTGETTLRAYHTKRVRQNLPSRAATGLLNFGVRELVDEAFDGYNGPVLVPSLNFYQWADHETRRLAFIPDRCLGNSPTSVVSNQPSCAIAGTNSITLPAGTDIHTGLLTIEYAEKDLIRSITFRIPLVRGREKVKG